MRRVGESERRNRHGALWFPNKRSSFLTKNGNFLKLGPMEQLNLIRDARNFLLAKHSVDPGNPNSALLRLNDNVVALLEAIKIILIDRDMLKGTPVSPGSDNQAAAARERARRNFSD